MKKEHKYPRYFVNDDLNRGTFLFARVDFPGGLVIDFYRSPGGGVDKVVDGSSEDSIQYWISNNWREIPIEEVALRFGFV